MRQLRAAGIKIWVLTGDKVETAINISISAGHSAHHSVHHIGHGVFISPILHKMQENTRALY